MTADRPFVSSALTAALLVGLYLGVGVFDHDIWAPVEPTIAGVVWNMVEGGNLAVPFVNTDPFVEKPPFYYWLAWLTSTASGRFDAGTLRLPAAVLGLGCLGLIFWIARRAFGTRVACVTTLLGGLSVMLWDTAHRAASDVSATFFVFACFALFARGLDSTAKPPAGRRHPWDLAFCLALAASFYAKNVFTFLLVLPPVATVLLLRREPRRLGTILALTGALLVALLTPWIVAVYREGGAEQLRIIFFDNTIGRFLSLEEYLPHLSTSMSDALLAEKEPFYFYLPRLLAYPLPWTAIALVGVVDLVRARHAWTELDRFLLVGILAMPIALSLSSSKSTDYMVPILFFDVLIVGRFLAEVFAGTRTLAPWERALFMGNLVVALVLLAVFPLVLFAVFGGLGKLVLLPFSAAAALWLARGLRAGSADSQWFLRFTATATVAAIAGLAIAIPEIDRDKSYRPFFEATRPLAEGRPIVSTFHEINRLPLINYYLDTHAAVFHDFETVAEMLRSDEPVGAFVRCERYDAARKNLSLPGVSVIREPQRDAVCFLANR